MVSKLFLGFLRPSSLRKNHVLLAPRLSVCRTWLSRASRDTLVQPMVLPQLDQHPKLLQVLKIYRFRILKSTKSRFGKMVVPLFWGPTLSFGCAASWCPTLVNAQSDKSIDALMCFSLKLDPAALFNCPKTIFELTSGTGSIA